MDDIAWNAQYKKEFENKAFPLNIILNFTEVQNWQNEYYKFYNYDSEIIKGFSNLNPTKLLSLQLRQSAAYKGIMVLALKNHCRDFISGKEMYFTVYNSENPDIHHIFLADYCRNHNLLIEKWNSVVNKTPITYSTNREIGGVAPSEYLKKMKAREKRIRRRLTAIWNRILSMWTA